MDVTIRVWQKEQEPVVVHNMDEIAKKLGFSQLGVQAAYLLVLEREKEMLRNRGLIERNGAKE